MKPTKQHIYTCEEIQTGEAYRSASGTTMYQRKQDCQNRVDKLNACPWRDGKIEFELVTYELKRV